jgi:hypothetical protein
MTESNLSQLDEAALINLLIKQVELAKSIVESGGLIQTGPPDPTRPFRLQIGGFDIRARFPSNP